VAPVVRRATRSGAADRWFFLRYGDPDQHLRVRLHGRPERLRRSVLPALERAVAPFLADGRIWRVTVDTYEREIERYGGPEGIELAEELFHRDSEAALDIIERLDPGDAGLDERWRLALRGMDQLLDDLGFDLAAKRAIADDVRRSFAAEFRANGPLRGQLGERFRTEQAALTALLDRSRDGTSALAPGLAALDRRSERLRGTAAELAARAAAGRLTAPLREIAASYLHMHANRLIRSAPREHELVLYDFLSRLYTAAAHRRGPSAG